MKFIEYPDPFKDWKIKKVTITQINPEYGSQHVTYEYDIDDNSTNLKLNTDWRNYTMQYTDVDKSKFMAALFRALLRPKRETAVGEMQYRASRFLDFSGGSWD